MMDQLTALTLALHLIGGTVIGGLYFGSLWWQAQRFERAGRLRTLLASIVLRFALLAGILTAASFEGALPLLATALGVLLARFAALRRVAMATP